MRIGLFFSRAEGVLAQAVDMDSLTRGYPADVHVAVYDNFYEPWDLNRMLGVVRANALEAVVLAGESPLNFRRQRAGEQVLVELVALGVNLNRIGFVNLVEQLALVHQGQQLAATSKARLLIEVALEQVRTTTSLAVIPVAPRQSVAVLGITRAGVMAVQRLLQRGYAVALIDQHPRSPEQLIASNPGLQPLVTFLERHPRYQLHTGVSIRDFYGYAGDYVIEIEERGAAETLAVGAVVVADQADLQLTSQLRALINLEIDVHGYWQPRNNDTLQAYSSLEGIYLVADYPDLGQASAAADAAVLAVIDLLDCPEIKHPIAVSEVNDRFCGGCGVCVKTCIFHACRIDPGRKTAIINPHRCKGCGNCVTACPAGARDLLTYPKRYLLKAVEILSQFDAGQPKVLALLCEGCGYQALDAVAAAGQEYPVGVLPLKVRCGGSVDTQLILQAFKFKFDGVIIYKCQEGHCSNIVGSTDLDRRGNLFRSVLRSRGIDTDRLQIVEGINDGDNQCVQAIAGLYQSLQAEVLVDA